MSKILKANNLELIEDAVKAYLFTNYLSGVTSIKVINSQGFSNDDYVILGNFGSETSEIVQITNVDSTTHTFTLASATKFAHAESTRVTIIKYDQVIFYHTATATFATSDLLDTIDIQADSFNTQYEDTVNSTGFGWYVFYNSTTTDTSDNSAAIPYAGYDKNSAKAIIDRFFSLLNSKELKLISEDDAFDWLNEGYSIAVNHLNLINHDYNVTSDYTLSVVSGTAEQLLPSNFSKIISIYSGTDSVDIDSIDIKDVSYYNSQSGNTLRYYIRGSYIGFTPTPDKDMTIYIKYLANSAVLTDLYSNVELPNNNYYCLQDYMLFRASNKIARIDGSSHFKLFYKSIDEMKINSINQDNSLDVWEIVSEANN